MRTRAIAKGLLSIGLLLSGYSIASASAITGRFSLGFGNPDMRVHVVLLSISMSLIALSAILFFTKNDDAGEVPQISKPELTADDLERLISIDENDIADIHKEF